MNEGQIFSRICHSYNKISDAMSKVEMFLEMDVIYFGHGGEKSNTPPVNIGLHGHIS